MGGSEGSALRAGAGLAGLLVLLALAASALADARPPLQRVLSNTPPPGATVFDGRIYQLASFRKRVFARGDFHAAGPYNGSGIGLDADTGARIGGFPVSNGQISDIIGDGAGGWYLTGGFSSVGSLGVPGIVHVLADGDVDTRFRPEVGGEGGALALAGGRLFVGGSFFRQDERDPQLIALDAETGALDWAKELQPRVGELAYAPAAPGRSERLLVGTGKSGQLAQGLTALDPATGDAVPGFDPPPTGTTRALAVGADQVYVGGSGLVALDLATGAPIPSFQPGGDSSGGTVHALDLEGNRLYAGGDFERLGGAAGPLVALDPTTGSAVPGFRAAGLRPRESAGDTGVFDLAVTPHALWVGGELVDQQLELRPLSAVDLGSGARLDVTPPLLNERVNALASSGSRLYAGGWFFLADAFRVDKLAALRTGSLGIDHAVTGVPSGAGRALNGGTMLVGQDRLLFTRTNFEGYAKPPANPWESTRGRIAVVDARNGKYRDGYGIRNPSGVAIGGDEVYVARRTSPNTQRYPRIQIDVHSLRTGTLRRSFELPLRGYVTKLDVAGGSLYAAGSFRRFRPDGTPAHLAVLKVDRRDGALDRGFDPHVNGPVYDFTADPRQAFLSGLFHRAGPRGPVELRRQGLVAADPSSGLPLRRFDYSGARISNERRVDLVPGCLAVSGDPPTPITKLRSDLSGAACHVFGRRQYTTDVAPAGRRIAYVDTNYAVIHGRSSAIDSVALVDAP